MTIKTNVALRKDDVSADTQVKLQNMALSMGEKRIGPVDVNLGASVHLTPGKLPLEALHDALLTLVTRGLVVEAKIPNQRVLRRTLT